MSKRLHIDRRSITRISSWSGRHTRIGDVSITDHQRQAIEAYFELMRSQPRLFEERRLRPLVLARAAIERYVAETGNTVGVITRNPYFSVVVDLVRKGNDLPGPQFYTFVRIVSAEVLRETPGVLAVPIVVDSACGRIGDYVLVKQERHATGKLELEFSRGGRLQDESPEHAVLRELREETGLFGSVNTYIGNILLDGGLSDGSCSAFAIDVFAIGKNDPDYSEAIVESVHMSRVELLHAIASGACRDSLSIAAFCMMGAKMLQ